MIYLDYSATTPVEASVLDTFVKVTNNYIGNPNSLHKLGIKSKNLIKESTKQIANLLNRDIDEIIYTSGSSESNNMAIKGICERYNNRGKTIITTHFEHSSINEPLKYLENNGYIIKYVKTNEYGIVDLESLDEMIDDETILVTICSVSSESGLLQPIEEINNVIKKHKKCFFHVDATQSIGKVNINLKDIDLVSFTAHKIYGLKGIGCLIKKSSIEINPLIHGGKSTTIYRSGTPSAALIASFSKALRLSLIDLEKKEKYVLSINNLLKEELNKYEKIVINSNEYCIPHILNFSVLGMKPETLQHAFEEFDIYISTQSACAKGEVSSSIYALTNSKERASSSVRISLSYKTTIEEINEFKKALKVIMEKYYVQNRKSDN